MDRIQTIREHEAFRNLLQAFARPGSIRPVSRQIADREAALELLASSLLDSESSLAGLWEEDDHLIGRICAATGCLRSPASLADFVLAGTRGMSSFAAALRTGDPDFPDRGATVVYLVDRIRPDGGSWTWKGPGIERCVNPQIDGLAEGEWSTLRDANSSYPLGLDAIFIDRQGALAAIPRSTRLEEVVP